MACDLGFLDVGQAGSSCSNLDRAYLILTRASGFHLRKWQSADLIVVANV